MLMRADNRILRVAVLALYALAMLALGVVRHDGLVAPSQALDQQSINAYVLPGARSIFLCRHEGGDQPSPAGFPADRSCCDACLIIHAPGLASTAMGVQHHLKIVRIVYATIEVSGEFVPLHADPTARGPPVV